jgi:hypothetical protein
MAILLVTGAPGTLGTKVAMRLVAQGDEVRVVSGAEHAPAWRELGVHVATGDPGDPDLIERAAQNCRTIVLLGPPATEVEVATAVVDGGAAAGVDRLIACRARERGSLPSLEAWRHGIVVLEQATGRWPRAKVASDELVAEAIDAADDLAGEPHLEVDLNDPASLAALGL